jgi:hypothetical protein
MKRVPRHHHQPHRGRDPYRECFNAACPYRSRAIIPYTRKGGPQGASINAGFAGDGLRTEDNYSRLTDPDYAYTPFVPPPRPMRRCRPG